jgi:phosphogluconate dehydratase
MPSEVLFTKLNLTKLRNKQMTSRQEIILRVTKNIIERSKSTREEYLAEVEIAKKNRPNRGHLSCGNLAHAFAASNKSDKQNLAGDIAENIGIITSYNDMLSAHQPYETFPEVIKEAAREVGGVAQVAGGVPAMCDGVTQGQKGMELSLFSRDIIAMATTIGLSHNMFDSVLLLGICDKIVPGLLIGALNFGHLPSIFVPAGPMPSGLPNPEKQRIRQLYAEGKLGRDELLKAEMDSYHSPGTCTFYGTANSNQMLMEFMGLHLPGSSFINPNTPLREALTKEAAKRSLSITASGNEYTPISDVINEKAIVNGIIGLHTTGGSTNHVLHLVAIAKAAGIQLKLEDISDLAEASPLLARVYPNGMYDVNHFHAAGGLPYLIGELLREDLLHHDVMTIAGKNLSVMAQEPKLDENNEVFWEEATTKSANPKVIATVAKPFSETGGLKVLNGNLGESVIKVSAVKSENRIVEAAAKVFNTQEALQKAFSDGELNCDFIAVCRFQGPKSNGMPELHKLTPALSVLQDKGYKVALITDGRMSGASGKVPAAIHLSPEAIDGGPISLIQDGDIIRLDAEKAELNVIIDSVKFSKRTPAKAPSSSDFECGTGLLKTLRSSVANANDGATVF